MMEKKIAGRQTDKKTHNRNGGRRDDTAMNTIKRDDDIIRSTPIRDRRIIYY